MLRKCRNNRALLGFFLDIGKYDQRMANLLSIKSPFCSLPGPIYSHGKGSKQREPDSLLSTSITLSANQCYKLHHFSPISVLSLMKNVKHSMCLCFPFKRVKISRKTLEIGFGSLFQSAELYPENTVPTVMFVN